MAYRVYGRSDWDKPWERLTPDLSEEDRHRAMRIDKQQRQLARERDHYLWSLTLDGSERKEPSGVFEACSPLPPECYAELVAMVKRWIDEGKV